MRDSKDRHHSPLPADVIFLPPGEGRHYPCGPMHAVFLADGEESGDRYAVSIWWVASGQPGPGAHSHNANEELFYVVEGTMTFLVGDQYVDAAAGAFLRVPAGVTHDFENRTAHRAGVFNVFIPGGFEPNMPAIVEWFGPKESDDVLVTDGNADAVRQRIGAPVGFRSVAR